MTSAAMTRRARPPKMNVDLLDVGSGVYLTGLTFFALTVLPFAARGGLLTGSHSAIEG